MSVVEKENISEISENKTEEKNKHFSHICNQVLEIIKSQITRPNLFSNHDECDDDC